MKYRWDLSDLYLNNEDFYLDMTLIRDKLKDLNCYKEIKIDGNNLYNLIARCFLIREMNYKTLLYASLNYYLDINNKFCIKMKTQAEELDLDVSAATMFIDELILVIDEEKWDVFYEECSDLKKYQHYIDNVRRRGIHIINNDITNNCLESINSSLVSYNNVIKNMNFEIEGVSLNTSSIGSYLINKNRSVREKSFRVLNDTYLNNRDSFFKIFKDIILNRKRLILEKKYVSVLESELFNDDINPIYIDKLIKNVNENIYLMNKYLKMKCDYLKINDPALYDINIPIIECCDKYKIDDAINILKDVFKVFGDEYLDSFNKLINNNHLDLESNDKKHPSITFSWGTYSFTNYKNRYIDLKNLSHEIGHIINSYFSIEKQPFIYNDSTVFTGEVVSLVNEILLNDYLYKSSKTKEQKIFYLTKIIENYISQVYRQTMYTEFEKLVYNKDQLDIDYLCNSYLDLVRKYYGDVVNINDNISSEWMRVGHLFRWSYYVYKYASGYILAFSIISNLNNKEYISKYIDFLSSGCSCSNYDLLKKLDIDLYDDNLMENSFKFLERYLLELEELLNEEK